VEHLQAQTVKDRLEVVIVAPLADKLDLDASELQGFLQCRVVEVGEMGSTAKAMAAGVRQASALIVAFLEDHSYPDPGWAEALIRAHRQPWAAVGPEIRNANPESLISRADLFLNSSRWMEPAEAGVVGDLQGRNAAYKRALLLEYGAELREQFYVAWLVSSSRARYWSLLRRVLYIGGSPLIPPLRLWRILRDVGGPGRPCRLLLRTLPIVVIGLVAAMVGEVVGHTFGMGHASQRVGLLEFHRHQR
jgi:hypothetical protein